MSSDFNFFYFKYNGYYILNVNVTGVGLNQHNITVCILNVIVGILFYLTNI